MAWVSGMPVPDARIVHGDAVRPTREIWQSGDVTLYCADCREILPTLSGIDALITDPPYGVNGTQHTRTARVRHYQKNDYTAFDDSPEYVEQVVLPSVSVALKLARRGVITPGNICLTMYPRPSSFGCFFQPASVGLQPWGRADAQPILYYGKYPLGSKNLPGQKCSYILTESAPHVGHPCPKPISAWTRLVEAASLPGETILDIFMGSGTTGVACVRTGRKFIGIEIEPRYFEIAKRRIAEAQNSAPLFEKAPEQRTLFVKDSHG